MATNVAYSSDRSAPARLVGPGRLTPGRTCAVLVGLELIFLYFLLSGNGWVYDDNLSLALARQYGFTWHWLTLNLFGHFEIAHRAIFSVQMHLMPLDYRWALVTMLGLLAVALFLFQRSLRLLLGDGWVPVLATVYFGISILLIAPLQWWSTGLEAFPTLVFDMLCLWAYLRYQTHPERRWIVVSAGAIAVGLLFYEKPSYMPLYLLLIRILLLNSDLRPRAVMSAIWSERRMWAAYIAVVGAYVILRESSGAGTIASGGSPSLSQWAQFFRIVWAQTLIPALFGLRIPATGLSGLQLAAVLALQVVVLVGLVAALRMRRGAWRAWVVCGLCFVASTLLVGAGRLADFGPGVGSDPRYLVDFAWLVPLLVCLGFSRSIAFRPAVVPSGGTTSRASRRWVAVGASVLLGAYAAASLASAVHLQNGWLGRDARGWEGRVEAGLAAANRSGRHPVVADNQVPWYIVEIAFSPFDQLSRVLWLYGGPVQVDGPLDGPLEMLDPSGRLHPARIAGQTATVPVPRQACVWTGSPLLRVQRRLRIAADQSPGDYYLRVGYWSARGGALSAYPDHGTGFPDSPDVSVSLGRGAGQSIAWLGPGSFRGVILDVPSGAQVCLRSVDIITLAQAA